MDLDPAIKEVQYAEEEQEEDDDEEAKETIQIRLQNIVATVNLGTQLDLVRYATLVTLESILSVFTCLHAR